MKALPGRYSYVVLMLGILGCILITSYAQQKPTAGASGKVEVMKDAKGNVNGIVIHPGKTLTAQQERDLEKALGAFNESLYKLEKRDKGKVETKGSLSDAKLSASLKSELADARVKNLSGYDVVFTVSVSVATSATRDYSKELAQVVQVLQRER